MNWQVILIIGLLTFCVSTGTVQERTYYVISNDLSESDCPVEKCQNLTALLNNTATDNFSNVIIYLLSGIHQISTGAIKIISITSASNLTISSFNFSTRGIIRCDGNVAFEFHSCKNLTIKDITIEECGAPRHFDHQKILVTQSNFSVYISHSLGVYIINTHILNGSGIGLLTENVHKQLKISNSIISHNECNLYIINYDKYTSNTTVSSNITVHNSSFSYSKNHSLPHSRGMYVYLHQTKFLTELVLTHVNLVENERNLFFRFTLCNEWSLVKIYNLRSITLNNEQNLYLNLVYSKKCNIRKQTNFIIKNAEVIGGKITIQSIGQITTNNHKVIICNTNISKSLFLISLVKWVLLKNIVIQNCYTDATSFKNMHIDNSVVEVRGLFLYQRNIRVQMTFKRSKITLKTNSTFVFRHNSHLSESPLYCTESQITMMSGSSMSFSNNTGYQSGGLTLLSSTITFKGNTHIIFVHNIGKRGGAMAFYALSKLISIKEQTNITFTHNHASMVGGAIFVQDYDYTPWLSSNKFIQQPKRGIKPPNFNFVNNSAVQAGDALYGGAANRRDFLFDNANKDKFSVGSTNPFKVCMCINSIPHCEIKKKRYRPIPGQLFKIDVVAVGWWNGVVPANIQIKLNETSNATVKANEHIQSAGRNCTTLTYTLTFTKQYELMDLQVITTNRNPAKEVNLKILLLFKNCSLGFSFTSVNSICICNKVLTEHGVECDIETLTVKRQNSKWINATFEHLLPPDKSGVIVHDHCPYDYCESSINGATQSLNLSYPDQQCTFHQSETLCGGCQTNFSQVLGTSKCVICSNSRLPLLLFLIAIAGLALVVCLTLLNITVTVGTINGLIFYAHIVKATNAFFFPQLASDSNFSIFIAWLNLDLGIETCFYNGLDAYAKTWLQFVFPLYIWLIVITIITVSHYSTKVSNLIGNNSVHVLATLFLLSYAKLLRIIITIFSSTQLTYPDGYVRTVWLYDGNVDFLKGKHIPLFITALMFLVLVSVPLTAILTFIQCLQKISHYRLLAWVSKLQPLFDAYTGPYKIKHRYWTGLLLLTRICLFLVFSLNIFGDPIINLLAIVATVFSLLTYLSIIGGVYKSWWLNVIESAFIMNLGLLSAAGLYKVAADVSITPITNTSTSIAFILFMVIVLYHIIIKVSETKYGKVTITNIKKFVNNCWQRETELMSVNENITESVLESIVTHSEVELREPLLATND